MSPEDFIILLNDAGEQAESGSMREALHGCVKILHEGFETNFLRAEDASGASWPVRKDDLPHPLLILHGDLIEAARDVGNPNNLLHVDDRELVTGISGSGVPYAATHNYGRENIPQREFLYANEEVQEACEEVMADALLEMMFPE